MKGSERVAFTMAASTRFKPRRCSSAPRLVTTSTTPIGMPASTAMQPDTPTINSVSSSEVASASISCCGFMSKLLHGDVARRQVGQGLVQGLRLTLDQNEGRTHGHALHVLDACLDQADIQ